MRTAFLPILCLLVAAASGRAQNVDLHGDPLPPGAVARFGTVRWRTGVPCVALAYTADGKRLLSVDQVNGCCVWEVATGKKLRQFGPAPDREYRVAAFSQDRQLVAIGGEYRLAVWDVAAGKLLWKRDIPAGHRDMVAAVAFSPDAKTLAWREYCTAAVELHDARTGDAQGRLSGPKTTFGMPATGGNALGTHSLAFSPDARQLAAAGEHGQYCLHDLDSFKSMPPILEKPRLLQWPVFSPDGKRLAWLEHGKLFVSNGDWTAPQLDTAPENSHGFDGLSFSPDSKRLACLDMAGSLYVWNLAAAEKMTVPKQRGYLWGWRACLAFAPDGQTVAVSRGPRITFCDVAKGRWAPPDQGHADNIAAFDLAPDGKTLLTHGWDETLCFWDAATGKLRDRQAASLRDGGALRGGLLFTPDSKAFVFADANGQLCLRNAATGAKVQTFAPPQIAEEAAALAGQPFRLNAAIETAVRASDPEGTHRLLRFADGGKSLLTWQRGGIVCRWDVTSGTPVRRSRNVLPSKYVDLDLASDGRRFTTLTGPAYERTLALWDAGQALPRWKVTLGPFVWPRPHFDPMGKNVAVFLRPRDQQPATGRHVLFHVLDAATGKERRGFQREAEEIQNLVFSPDGRWIVSWSEEHMLRLWDVSTAKEVHAWMPHPAGLWHVFFSRDGKRLVTTGADTTALLWDVAALVGPQPAPVKPTPAEIDTLWQDLGDTDGRRSFDAVCRLAAAPAQALPLLCKQLQAVPKVDTARLGQLIDDLGSESFAARQKAGKALENLGEVAEPTLRAALVPTLALEQRLRIQALLRKLEEKQPTPADLRAVRALEVLERIGTLEALALMETMAAGAPESRFTQDAQLAVDRIKARLPVSP